MIETNLKALRVRIQEAAERAGRSADDITLIAVSKFQGIDAIRAALAAGQRDFGENRIQEAQAKWPALLSEFDDARLHFLGGLQSNKAADAVRLCHVIHSVDRPKIAAALAREMAAQGVQRPCFIQVNTGEEPQKSGVLPKEAPDFIAHCRDVLKLPVVGLMCVPPVEADPAVHFAFLADLARRHGLGKLSMGMSGDFETAIELGATHVRVGTSLFGARPPAL